MFLFNFKNDYEMELYELKEIEDDLKKKMNLHHLRVENSRSKFERYSAQKDWDRSRALLWLVQDHAKFLVKRYTISKEHEKVEKMILKERKRRRKEDRRWEDYINNEFEQVSDTDLRLKLKEINNELKRIENLDQEGKQEEFLKRRDKDFYHDTTSSYLESEDFYKDCYDFWREECFYLKENKRRIEKALSRNDKKTFREIINMKCTRIFRRN